MLKKFLLGLLLVFSFSFPLSSWAAFSDMVSFGDSLSDNGIGIIPDGSGGWIKYDMEGFDTFSNGDVWVDYLAERLGIGHDGRAYGGARTGTGTFDLLSQINTRYTSASDISSTLFSVWAGGNDLRDLANSGSLDPAYAAGVIGQAVTNLSTAINDLYSLGARHILIPNLPDLGLIPEFFGTPLSGLASYGSGQFNMALSSLLDSISLSDLTIYEMKVDLLFADPALLAEFTNTTEPWLGSGEDPSTYLFYDNIHPTTRGHWFLADYAAQLVSAPSAVPVPSALLLMGAGLVCLVGLRREAA